jgi:hypothetical protein
VSPEPFGGGRLEARDLADERFDAPLGEEPQVHSRGPLSVLGHDEDTGAGSKSLDGRGQSSRSGNRSGRVDDDDIGLMTIDELEGLAEALGSIDGKAGTRQEKAGRAEVQTITRDDEDALTP